ncbi:Nn.00g035610.m01.CDS01 [Neocucurbitaria sp. VM-36]
MATSASTMTFAPHQPSPLARTISPFKDPRPPPPCTPAKTAKLWDEYEKRALENARRRDGSTQVPYPQRTSTSDIARGDESNSAPATTMSRTSFDFRFRRARAATPSTTVAICKTCKQPITYASGICERCMKKIILPAPTGETTPPLSPAARNFASTDLLQLHRNSSLEEMTMPTSTSPKQKSFCPLPIQLIDPPIRLSSLRPPPLTQPDASLEPNRSRKTSLTDPNEPFLRLQITQQTYTPPSYSHPTTPTYSNLPTTPPSTRPSSLANVASLPATTSTSTYPYDRKTSVTPSEFSALYPYASTTTTSPPSLCRVSDAQQGPTSAWDDWDSDDEEKVRLVGWIGRKKGKKWGKERGGSKDSFESVNGGGSGGGFSLVMSEEARKKKERKERRDEERLEAARRETVELIRVGKGAGAGDAQKKKKRRAGGFVRVISCGCSQE